jgi:hypothetical protein
MNPNPCLDPLIGCKYIHLQCLFATVNTLDQSNKNKRTEPIIHATLVLGFSQR